MVNVTSVLLQTFRCREFALTLGAFVTVDRFSMLSYVFAILELPAALAVDHCMYRLIRFS
jgi:hypothetical protein